MLSFLIWLLRLTDTKEELNFSRWKIRMKLMQNETLTNKQTGNPLIYARFIRAMSAADTNIGHAYCKC